MVGFNYPTAQEIVAEYLRQLDSGTPVTEEDVISTHRQLEEELRAEFRKLNLIKIAVTQSDEVKHIVTSTSESADGIDADTVTTRPHPLPTTVLRCPNCNEPMDAMLEGSFRAVECEACGKQFSLVRERQWPKQIAHFELLERIGMGGFGSVWKARDRELDRLVALKLPRRAFVEESDADQFLHEAQTAARLNHPNIVRVHEVGLFEGSIYIASELIDGRPLSQHIGHGLTEKEAVRLTEPIGALHYAHECGVVHRDLKPQNVILGSDGKPYLSDFGLARSGDTDLSLTVSGQILGTPGYMSPEQARGESRNADARSDIYSLGILLYELLTAQVPFQGLPETVFLRVQHEDPVNPRKLNHSVSVDVDTICMKCLEKDPDRRYQTALEVAEELDRVATGNPIFARPVGIAERSFRWAKRNPTVAALTVGLLITFMAASLLGSYLFAQMKITEVTERQSLLTEIRQILADAKADYRDRIFQLVQVNSDLRRDEGFSSQLRDLVVLSLGDFAAYQALELISDDGGAVTSAAISSDGSRIGIGFSTGRVEIRDLQNLEVVIWETHVDELVAAIHFRQRSRNRIYLLGDKGSLYQLFIGNELVKDRLAMLHGRPSDEDEESRYSVTSARFSTNGLFVAFTNGTHVGVWNIEQGTKVDKLPTVEDASTIRCVAVSRDGQKIAAGHSNDLGSVGGVLRWDLTSDRFESTPLHRGRQYRNGITISDDAQWMAVGCERTVIFEMATLEKRLFFHDTEVSALEFSPDSSYVAVSYISNIVEIWNRKTNMFVARLKQETGNGVGVAFSQDKSRFLAWSSGGIQVLDLGNRTERIQIDFHERAIPEVCFSTDGKRLVSCSKDGSIRSWDPSNGNMQSAEIEDLGQIQCVALHPNNAWIAVAQWAKNEPLTIWSFADKACKKLVVVDNDIGHISGLDFSPDGKFLAASGDQGLGVWRLEISNDTPSPVALRRENDPTKDEDDKGLVFDKNGRHVFHSDTWGDRVRFYDVQKDRSGDLGNADDENEIDAHEGWHGIAFTSENRLVFVNPQGGLEIWDVDDMSNGGLRMATFGNGSFSDSNIAINRDNLLAGKSGPKTVSIWDLNSRQRIYTFRQERSTIYSMAWSPDGQKLALGLSDGGISIWDVSKVRAELRNLGFAY